MLTFQSRGPSPTQRSEKLDSRASHPAASRSGTLCWALLLAPQQDLKASKTAEFDESILLDGKLSVALGKALAKHSAGKTQRCPPPTPR